MSNTVTTNQDTTSPAPVPSPIVVIAVGTEDDAACLQEIAAPELAKPCSACCGKIVQFTDGLLSLSRLPADPGEAAAAQQFVSAFDFLFGIWPENKLFRRRQLWSCHDSSKNLIGEDCGIFIL
jgi:hypothetical protein